MSPLARFALVTLISVGAPMVAFQAVFGSTRAAATGHASPDNSCVAACRSGSDWVAPVEAPILQGFRPASNRGHEGVDLGAERGTPIRAAAAGVVTRVECSIVPTSYGCDRDGSPQNPGCGWYVDIRHFGDIYTRYCHMIRRPSVEV